MRPAPGPIPKKPPAVSDACAKIARIVAAPRTRLGDASLQRLFEDLGDGTPAWLTGSSVWLPAVYGAEPDRDGDLDVIFASQEGADRFIKSTLGELNRRIPGTARYSLTKNSFGSGRILHPDGKPVFDIWACEEDQTIHEALMQYPAERPDIRCAYLLSRSPSGASLVRMLPQKQKQGLFEGIRESSAIAGSKAANVGYPGRY